MNEKKKRETPRKNMNIHKGKQACAAVRADK